MEAPYVDRSVKLVKPEIVRPTVTVVDGLGTFRCRGEGVSVTVRQRSDDNVVHIHWARTFLSDGWRIKVFRSSTGFHADDSPVDQALHGQMVFESYNVEGDFCQELPAGTYYYTVFLQRPTWFGCFTKATDPVRFPVEVASHQIATSMVKDQHQYEDAAHQLELHRIRQRGEIIDAELAVADAEARQAARDKANGSPASKLDELLEQFVERVVKAIHFQVGSKQAVNEIRTRLQQDGTWRRMSPRDRKKVADHIQKILRKHDIEERIFRDEL